MISSLLISNRGLVLATSRYEASGLHSWLRGTEQPVIASPPPFVTEIVDEETVIDKSGKIFRREQERWRPIGQTEPFTLRPWAKFRGQLIWVDAQKPGFVGAKPPLALDKIDWGDIEYLQGLENCLLIASLHGELLKCGATEVDSIAVSGEVTAIARLTGNTAVIATENRASADSELLLVNTETGKVKRLGIAPGVIYDILPARNHIYVVSSVTRFLNFAHDLLEFAFDGSTLRKGRTLARGGHLTAAVSPDGRVACGDEDGFVSVWTVP